MTKPIWITAKEIHRKIEMMANSDEYSKEDIVDYYHKRFIDFEQLLSWIKSRPPTSNYDNLIEFLGLKEENRK